MIDLLLDALYHNDFNNDYQLKVCLFLLIWEAIFLTLTFCVLPSLFLVAPPMASGAPAPQHHSSTEGPAGVWVLDNVDPHYTSPFSFSWMLLHRTGKSKVETCHLYWHYITFIKLKTTGIDDDESSDPRTSYAYPLASISSGLHGTSLEFHFHTQSL